ncbi:unnamed protein product [Sphenostylis stenocarpa]|uniref:Uncharacterized protein n=1 Tax=Sphenostylis stenocarpa TaxID=92480 RepID=A0AA86S5T8_9FABA|nr:unnamed protein product [Sphenostylis stenocarpa]
MASSCSKLQDTTNKSNSDNCPGEMSPATELRWLCRLLDDSLRPYTVCFTLPPSALRFPSFIFIFYISPLIPFTKDAFLVLQEPRASVSISKEKEREILIASSQVVTKIQLRIREFDSGAEADHASNEEELCGSNQHSSVDQCLPKIVDEMMVLLTVKSEFVQHVAVNALALTSRFVYTTV